jgi:hypothetical protein
MSVSVVASPGFEPSQGFEQPAASAGLKDASQRARLPPLTKQGAIVGFVMQRADTSEGGDMTTLIAWVSYPKSKQNISAIYPTFRTLTVPNCGA